jgi:hypothetical protein
MAMKSTEKGTELAAAEHVTESPAFVERLTSRTAVYGPVRTVVWEGWSREAPPYPDV